MKKINVALYGGKSIFGGRETPDLTYWVADNAQVTEETEFKL